ncbi:hypothetical protein KJZ63_00455 [Patescibacteria group bacterium]|nr:hypothetical protein [Patescibacteria group bacterium]
MRRNPELNPDYELDDRPKITPHLNNEFSPLVKVMVVRPPQEITSFNDLIVNPVQAFHAQGNPVALESKPIATRQFRGLMDTLESQGIELVYSDVEPGRVGHTPLFTRDVGVIIGGKVLPSVMKYDYRKGEVDGIYQNIAAKNIIEDSRPYTIEGGDFALLNSELALVGIGPRTNEISLEVLRDHFPGTQFVPVYPVFEDKAFHIDTVMGILGNKSIVCIPEWIPDDVIRLLQTKGYQLIEASKDEYTTCCTNVLAIADRKVISAAENKQTNQRMREGGIEVIEVELSDILTQGGGPHCLTLPLVRK